MRTNLRRAESSITLSAAVLSQLKSMSAGPLRVYIYLCSCYAGQPFLASIPELAAATGLARRALISALKILRDGKLIIRLSGRRSDNCFRNGSL